MGLVQCVYTVWTRHKSKYSFTLKPSEYATQIYYLKDNRINAGLNIYSIEGEGLQH